MNKMGYMYSNGSSGLPQDDAQAVTWFQSGRHR
jgi:TPR repeat protein